MASECKKHLVLPTLTLRESVVIHRSRRPSYHCAWSPLCTYSVPWIQSTGFFSAEVGIPPHCSPCRLETGQAEHPTSSIRSKGVIHSYCQSQHRQQRRGAVVEIDAETISTAILSTSDPTIPLDKFTRMIVPMLRTPVPLSIRMTVF